MDERLVAAVLVRALLLGVSGWNLRLAFRERRHIRDARSLRGYVAAITMFAGTIAFAASSPTIATAMGSPSLLAILTGAGVAVFLAGQIFSAVSWRVR